MIRLYILTDSLGVEQLAVRTEITPDLKNRMLGAKQCRLFEVGIDCLGSKTFVNELNARGSSVEVKDLLHTV